VIQKPVREITDAVDAHRTAWGDVDPYYVEVLLRSTLSAQIALMEPKLPESRDRLRFALDALALAFASIAEDQPVSDDRSGKEVVAWLAERAEVSQAELAKLVGVSPRQFQRWLSPGEKAAPEGDDLRRVRAIARIFNQLRFALTPAGAIAWFSVEAARPRRQAPDRPARPAGPVRPARRARRRHEVDDRHVIAYRNCDCLTPLRTDMQTQRRPGRYHRGTEAEPTQYLSLHPLGPHAEAMRRLDARTAGAGSRARPPHLGAPDPRRRSRRGRVRRAVGGRRLERVP